MKWTIKITFITPCFCRGADCSDHAAPEIRPASIRGQLHWWFRALGGTPQEENAIFGSVHNGAKASKVVVRVRCPLQPQTVQAPTLPHKTGGPAAAKKALAPGTSFDLFISTRLGGLSLALEEKFNQALDAWLLLGALGLRSTRGGGNFAFEGQPNSPDQYADKIFTLPIPSALLDATYDTAEAARCVITNTLAAAAFAECRFPLGTIRPNRKTSPLRFRIVKFADKNFRIIAIWDQRTNEPSDLQDAIQILQDKPIGQQLAQSSLA